MGRHRPRNGRIRLRGKWVKFPLNGKDLLLRLDKPFAIGAARDMALRSLPLAPGAHGLAFLDELDDSRFWRSDYAPWSGRK